MKPALLLDVDGVICPYDQGEDCTRYEFSARYRDDHVWISQGIKDRLKRLAKKFDFVWATAWEKQANEHLLDAYDLTHLPVIEFWGSVEGVLDQKMSGVIYENPHFRQLHWKAPWIYGWAREAKRPWAWIDDEVLGNTVTWGATLDPPALIVPINGRTGLTDSDVETLEQWASQLPQ